MKQLEDDTVCKFCYGCNRLEDNNFNGLRRCDDYLEAVPMGNRYIKAIRAKEENKDKCQ